MSTYFKILQFKKYEKIGNDFKVLLNIDSPHNDRYTIQFYSLMINFLKQDPMQALRSLGLAHGIHESVCCAQGMFLGRGFVPFIVVSRD